jgi:predicted DsbA family dithiol-disulfide isomerase
MSGMGEQHSSGPAYDGRMSTPHLTIDFVSDISCPWCAVGLSALQQALARVQPDISVTMRCQPFELNPQMGPGGQDIGEHLTQKYGSTPEQQAQIRDAIRQRGAAVGFAFHPAGRGRIYNTFNAHRLLHWAGDTHPEQQMALKMALLQACHRDQQAMDDPQVLLAAVAAAGLDPAAARSVLDSDAHSADVRAQQALYLHAGIHSVPAVVFNGQHLVSGGQPVEVYERVMRSLA